MKVCNNHLLYKRPHFPFFELEEGLKKGELVKRVPRIIYMLINSEGIRAISIRG
jgi:hypothetical protein